MYVIVCTGYYPRIGWPAPRRWYGGLSGITHADRHGLPWTQADVAIKSMDGNTLLDCPTWRVFRDLHEHKHSGPQDVRALQTSVLVANVWERLKTIMESFVYQKQVPCN